MKIAMISGHGCIRVQKMALPLIEKGHEVHLLSNKIPYFHEKYKSFSYWNDIGQLIEAIKLYSKVVDIFHAHNEPSWFVTIVKENTDIPVILDIHDSFLARMTPEEEEQLREKGENTYRVITEERNNFQIADALVFPSEPLKNLVVDEYNLKQPSIILPSYLPRKIYRYDCREWLGGLVYEGRVDLKSEIESSHKRRGFKYCEYENLARKASELGIDFHIRTTRTDKEFMNVYDDIAYVHKPEPITELVKHLTKHDWGLVGNIFKTSEWDIAFPNKMFEYIGASVPIVAINAPTCAEFIKKHEIGIEIDSLEELQIRWSEHEHCREKLIKTRQMFTMENNINVLEKLYKFFVAHN